MVEGLVLININPCAEGWMDWAAHKVDTHALMQGTHTNTHIQPHTHTHTRTQMLSV